MQIGFWTKEVNAGHFSVLHNLYLLLSKQLQIYINWKFNQRIIDHFSRFLQQSPPWSSQEGNQALYFRSYLEYRSSLFVHSFHQCYAFDKITRPPIFLVALFRMHNILIQTFLEKIVVAQTTGQLSFRYRVEQLI